MTNEVHTAKTLDTTAFVPIEVRVFVTSVIKNGASAFGYLETTGQQCYIPAAIINSARIVAGNAYVGKVVPNRLVDRRETTPWLMIYAQPQPGTDAAASTLPDFITRPHVEPVQLELPFVSKTVEAPPVEPPVVEAAPAAPTVLDTKELRRRMEAKMAEGGVWTTGSMFAELFPGSTSVDNKTMHNAVGNHLRSMFMAGLYSKWSFVRSAAGVRPGVEWFSAYPAQVSVVWNGSPRGMLQDEERVWAKLVDLRDKRVPFVASEVAAECNVSVAFVEHLLSKVGPQDE